VTSQGDLIARELDRANTHLIILVSFIKKLVDRDDFLIDREALLARDTPWCPLVNREGVPW
jgi:hypothetical protein